MRTVWILAVAMIIGMPAFFILQGPGSEVEGADAPIDENILYVDDSGGSTYDSVQGALIDAQPGDRIVVAPGSYGLVTTSDKKDLEIIGNATQGKVTIYGAVEFSPFHMYNCSNINVSGFNLIGSYDGFTIKKCSNINLFMNRIDTVESHANSIFVNTSDHVSMGWCVLNTTEDDSTGILLQETDYFKADGISVIMPGPGCDVLYSEHSTDTVLKSISGSYSGDLAVLENSTVSTVNMEVDNDDVSVDPRSSLSVQFFRRVITREEDNVTDLQGVDMELMVDGAAYYRTPHYGGSDDVSNEDGIFKGLPNVVHKVYSGSSVPGYITNSMRLYHDDLDVVHEMDLGVLDADTTSQIYAVFPDLRSPEEPRNVTTRTLNLSAMEVSFDASDSTDVLYYEIWRKDPFDWTRLVNTTDPGTYEITGLEPNTTYRFRVNAVDDAGLSSSYVTVQNRTLERTKGDLLGTLTYSGGPLNGTPAANSTVVLKNLNSYLRQEETADQDGGFEFHDLPFADDYYLEIGPPNSTEEESNTSGYINFTYWFDLSDDRALEIEVPYYQYVPETNGSINGTVTYLDGPMAGMGAANATVFLLNSTLDEIGNLTVNETGRFLFEDVPFGNNYTMWFVPDNEVGWNGTESGYVREVLHFYLRDDKTIDVGLQYFNYTPPQGPTSGDIFGRAVYLDGPKDGEGSPDAEVELINSSGEVVRTLYSNETGHYRFEDVIFGENFTLRVTPREEDRGENNIESGYLVWTSSAFDHLDGDTMFNSAPQYYEYPDEQPPIEEFHPNVTIVDEDGDPVAGVTVTVFVNGKTYTAVTDENGTAEFEELLGEDFPEGSRFRAEKEGFETVEWSQGDPVPPLAKEKDESGSDNTLLIIVIAIIAGLIILAAIFILVMGSSSGDTLSEE